MGIHVYGDVGIEKGASRTRDIPVPPVEKLACGGFSFWCLIVFEKVDDKLVELLVVKTIVVAHPVGSIIEGKVKLG